MSVLAKVHGGRIAHSPFPSSPEKDRAAPPRKSAEIIHLFSVRHCNVIHGVDYLRAASDIVRLVLPGHFSDHRRAMMIAQATDISFGTVERILAHRREGLKSIKVEYLVTLFRLATRNGVDVFQVRGVREVHDVIFGEGA